MTKTFSLSKSERVSSQKQIDKLFRGGNSKSMSAFPLRMVYMAEERETEWRCPVAQMMVSVPKRYFKRAVKRNHIKRQVREAYRLNKHVLTDTLGEDSHKRMALCFIWTDSQLRSSQEVHEKVKSLLARLSERIHAPEKPHDASSDGNTAHNNNPIPNAL